MVLSKNIKLSNDSQMSLIIQTEKNILKWLMVIKYLLVGKNHLVEAL